MNSISLFPAACAGHLWCAFSVDLGPYTDSLPATHPVNAARYIRFMQWGVFSAIFRPHDGGNADTRIWTFADEHYQILRDYTRLRGALTPWVYALAAKTRDESVPFSRPMWWDYENEAAANKEDARAMDEQFGFGEGVLVRPISEFISPDGDTKPPFNSSNVHAINSSSYSVWLPDGCWLNWDATQKICGPVRHSGVAQLRDVPVFVKPGTVLPMWPPGRRLLSEPPAKRTRLWTLFISSAGEVGRGSDHEDDGETLSLNASVTTLRYSYGSALLEVNVSVPVGSYDGMADSKTHALQVRGIKKSVAYVSDDMGVECCVGTGSCTAMHSGNAGDYSSPAYWEQPADMGEMAVTAGALVVVCPAVLSTEGLRITITH